MGNFPKNIMPDGQSGIFTLTGQYAPCLGYAADTAKGGTGQQKKGSACAKGIGSNGIYACSDFQGP